MICRCNEHFPSSFTLGSKSIFLCSSSPFSRDRVGLWGYRLCHLDSSLWTLISGLCFGPYFCCPIQRNSAFRPVQNQRLVHNRNLLLQAHQLAIEAFSHSPNSPTILLFFLFSHIFFCASLYLWVFAFHLLIYKNRPFHRQLFLLLKLKQHLNFRYSSFIYLFIF